MPSSFIASTNKIDSVHMRVCVCVVQMCAFNKMYTFV